VLSSDVLAMILASIFGVLLAAIGVSVGLALWRRRATAATRPSCQDSPPLAMTSPQASAVGGRKFYRAELTEVRMLCGGCCGRRSTEPRTVIGGPTIEPGDGNTDVVVNDKPSTGAHAAAKESATSVCIGRQVKQTLSCL
jgi:hypothetical protein